MYFRDIYWFAKEQAATMSILSIDSGSLSEKDCISSADAIIFDPNSMLGSQGLFVLGMLRRASSRGASIWIPKLGYDALEVSARFLSSTELATASKNLKAFGDFLEEGLNGVQLLEDYDLFEVIRQSADDSFRSRDIVLVTPNEIAACWYLYYERVESPSVSFCHEGAIYDINGENALRLRRFRHCTKPDTGRPFSVRGITLCGTNREPIVLENDCVGFGSEADVFGMKGASTVAKVYFNELTSLDIRKLSFLQFVNVDYLAKPLDVLAPTSSPSKVVGYTMKDYRPWPSLSFIFSEGTLDRFTSIRPTATRADAIDVAIDVVAKVKRLHFDGILVGDYGLSNFLVNPNTLKTVFIDVGGFTAEMISGKAIADEDFPIEFDYKDFSDCISSEYVHLAIAVFKMVTLGVSPFMPATRESPARFIFNGNCRNKAALSNWTSMPDSVQNLFKKVFVDFQLVSEDEIIEVLRSYSRRLRRSRR